MPAKNHKYSLKETSNESLGKETTAENQKEVGRNKELTISDPLGNIMCSTVLCKNTVTFDKENKRKRVKLYRD